MYKLIAIEEYDITRHVTLKNLETGTEDYCFDYSDMVDLKYNPKDFWFMEIGKKYDCKIELFGDTKPSQWNKVHCRVVKDNVLVGNRRRVEVKVGEDVYYVPRKEVEEYLKDGEFDYYYARKDLIQVDNIIHGDYLHD